LTNFVDFFKNIFCTFSLEDTWSELNIQILSSFDVIVLACRTDISYVQLLYTCSLQLPDSIWAYTQPLSWQLLVRALYSQGRPDCKKSPTHVGRIIIFYFSTILWVTIDIDYLHIKDSYEMNWKSVQQIDQQNQRHILMCKLKSSRNSTVISSEFNISTFV
jgi:hypothetical protein